MTIYQIELHKIGSGISGGEKCLIEVIKHFNSQRVPNVLITTDNARRVYEQLGLHEGEYFRYVEMSTRGTEWLHPFLCYIIRAFRAKKLVKKLQIESEDVLICNSQFFVNSIPFRSLAKHNPSTKLIYWFRILAPSIWRGFAGHFTDTFHWPTPHSIFYAIDQWLYRKTMFDRGIALTHNPAYLKELRRLCPKNQVTALSTYSGSDHHHEPSRSDHKDFDIVWLGRFQSLKGACDIVPICKHLIERGCTPRIAIIGGGSPNEERMLRYHVEEEGLTDAIKFVGYLKGDKKFDVLRKSKVFLMTSYFDSYPNVVIEAMAMGLPIIAYDLATYSVFNGGGIVKTPIGDTHAMADKILRLLESDTLRLKLSMRSYTFAAQRKWAQVGEQILEFLETQKAYKPRNLSASDPASFVLPAKDSGNTIGKTLEAIERQNLPSGSEIILVDDHSTDNTVNLTMNHPVSTSARIRLINNEASGLANAYNLGWQAASNECIIFMHPDCYVERPDALASMQAKLAQEGTVAALSKTILPTDEWKKMSFWSKVAGARYVGKKQYGMGGKFDAIRRSALEHIGGFDSVHFHGAGEDIDIGYRLRQIGQILPTDVEVVHAHEHPEKLSILYLLRKQAQLGQGWGAILRKYGKHPNKSKAPYLHTLKAVLFVSLLIPPLSIYSASALLLLGAAYSWKALLLPDWRIVLIPFLNVLQFAVFLGATLVGIIKGTQVARYK